MNSKHAGTSLDDHLKAEDTFAEAQVLAVKGVVAWHIIEAMERGSPRRAKVATMHKTSRGQVDRLLAPNRDVPPATLQRAAALVGRKLRIELV